MNLKQLLIIDIKGVIWCVHHPIVLFCSFLPFNKRIEHIQEKWFDCPFSYVPSHARKEAWKSLLLK